MMHDIAVALGTELASKKCPIKVIDGPEPTKTTTGARERIVVERDDDAGDNFGPPRNPGGNPRRRFTRAVAAKITIYAQAVGAGSNHWEHRRRAEKVLDLVLVALAKVLSVRQVGYTLGRGRFVPIEDLQESESASGAAYELLLTVERAVFDQTWTDIDQPEATVGGVDGIRIKNTVLASLNGDDLETVIPTEV